MRIRAVQPSEYDAVGALVVRAYAAILRDSWDDYRQELADVAGRVADGGTVLVAVDGDRLLGSVTYVPPGLDSALTEWDDPHAAGIRMLAVEPEEQGRGTGRALSLACIEAAQRDGARRLILHTTDANGPAKRLYESMGFRRLPAQDVEIDGRFWLRAYELPLLADDSE